VVEEIRSASLAAGTLTPLPMDLTDFASVRSAAASLGTRRLDYLFLNAGMVYALPPHKWGGPWLTADGFDHLFAANHLGHFLLCHLLLPLLKDTATDRQDGEGCARSRIIVTSSIAHWLARPHWLFRRHESFETAGPLEKFRMYGTSKLANLLFAYQLQRNLDEEGAPVDVAVVTPGLVASEIGNPVRGARSMIHWLPLAVAPSRGAETAVFAATSKEAVAARDAFVVPYFAPPLSRRWSWAWPSMMGWEMIQRLSWQPRLSRSSPDSYDTDLARRLWRFSRQAVGL
jgi:NAD(P)-dependent dehydrogenase (short-subunit alcohol dehydrogenase family)